MSGAYSYHLNVREVLRSKGILEVLGSSKLFGLLVRGLEGVRRTRD